MAKNNKINRRTFFGVVSTFFIGLFVHKAKPESPLVYYKKEFKRCLLNDSKDVVCAFRSTSYNKHNISDFHPEKQYGNAIRLKRGLKEVSKTNTFYVHILARNCALTIPKEFRHKAELKETEYDDLISWMYNGT